MVPDITEQDIGSSIALSRPVGADRRGAALGGLSGCQSFCNVRKQFAIQARSNFKRIPLIQSQPLKQIKVNQAY
jgi:hypothetical protein